MRSLSPQPHEEAEQQRSWWKFGSSKKEKDATEIAKEAEESLIDNIDKVIASIPADKSQFFSFTVLFFFASRLSFCLFCKVISSKAFSAIHSKQFL